MDTIDEVGFLSPQFEDWIKRHRFKHAEWFSLCERLNRFAQRFMLSFTAPRRDRRLVVAATVFSRIVSHFQAIILLAERGMILEARAVRRAALEATFIIGALLKDEKFIDDYAKDDEIRRKKSIKALVKQSDKELSELGVVREDLQNQLQEIDSTLSKEGIRELTVRGIAQRAQMEGHYETLYQLLCRTVHTRVKDLEGDIVMDAEGWPDQICWGPAEPAAIEEMLYSACDIMFIALRAAIDLSTLSVDGSSFTALQSDYTKLLQAKVATHTRQKG
jgi:Family of unknown function (DUF5677)